MLNYLHRLENFEDYHFPFEITSISEETKAAPAPEPKKSEPSPPQQAEKHEEEEEKIKPIPSAEENLASQKPAATPSTPSKEILPGLRNLGVRFVLLSEELSLLFSRPRFAKLFDAVVLGFFHGQELKSGFSNILKPGAKVYVELPMYAIALGQRM